MKKAIEIINEEKKIINEYASPIALDAIVALNGICVPLNIADGKVGKAILSELATVFFAGISVIIGKDIAKRNTSPQTNDEQKSMDVNA